PGAPLSRSRLEHAVNTDPETTEAAPRPKEPEDGAGAGSAGAEGPSVPGSEGEGPAKSSSGAEAGAAGPEGSEAADELAARRIERERIEQRKAGKKGPIEAGGKLSGKAADLLAAVRAVEGGEKPASSAFAEPAPAPRRPAPEPVRRTQPVAPPTAP